MRICASRADWGVLQLLHAALLQLINAAGGREEVLQGELNLPVKESQPDAALMGIWKQNKRLK